MKKEKIIYYIKQYKDTIRILVALILLGGVLSRIDFSTVMSLIQKINFLIIIPLILYIPGLILSSTRLRQIIDKKMGTGELFRINWISSFFSNFLPSNVGGDSYKIISLRKKLGTQFSLESVFIDRIVGVIGIIVLSCLSSFILYKQTKNLVLSLIPWTIFILFMILILVFWNKKFKLFKKYDINIGEYRKKLLNPRILLNSVIYTLLGAISLFVYYYMFGYSLNLFVVIGFYCFIQLLNMLPISINALGVQEVSSIYFFSLIGIPAEVSLAISLLSRIVLILQTSIGGLIYAADKV